MPCYQPHLPSAAEGGSTSSQDLGFLTPRVLSLQQRRLSGNVPLLSLRMLVSCLVEAWVLKPALLLEGSPVRRHDSDVSIPMQGLQAHVTTLSQLSSGNTCLFLLGGVEFA